jgi:hypothetical protein
VSWLVHLSPLAAAHYVVVATIAGFVSILIGARAERRDENATVGLASAGEMKRTDELRKTENPGDFAARETMQGRRLSGRANAEDVR